MEYKGFEREYHNGNIHLYQMDCMELLRQTPDKHYDLCVVDPPYGINIVEAIKKSTVRGTSNMFAQTKGGGGSDFDKQIPPKEYFDELKRVSKNQIIWGGNYFLDYLGKTDGFLVWDKMNGTNPMADAELAWKSFEGATRMFRMHHFSKGYEEKIHPTQKPTKLYDWIYDNFIKCKACKGQGGYYEDVIGDGGSRQWFDCDECDGITPKILDTHGGSMSSVISADKAGLEMVCCELDKEYFDKAVDRFKKYKSQNVLEFK